MHQLERACVTGNAFTMVLPFFIYNGSTLFIGPAWGWRQRAPRAARWARHSPCPHTAQAGDSHQYQPLALPQGIHHRGNPTTFNNSTRLPSPPDNLPTHLLAQLAEHDLRQVGAHAVLGWQLVILELLHHLLVLPLDLQHGTAAGTCHSSSSGGCVSRQRLGSTTAKAGRQAAPISIPISQMTPTRGGNGCAHLRAMPSHSRELKMPVLSDDSLRTRAKRLTVLLAAPAGHQGANSTAE